METKIFKEKLVKEGSSDLLVEFLGRDFVEMDGDSLYKTIDEILAQMPDDEYDKFCKMLEKDIETDGQYWE